MKDALNELAVIGAIVILGTAAVCALALIDLATQAVYRWWRRRA